MAKKQLTELETIEQRIADLKAERQNIEQSSGRSGLGNLYGSRITQINLDLASLGQKKNLLTKQAAAQTQTDTTQGLIDQYGEMWEDTRQANEQRYQDILGRIANLRTTGLGYLEGMGETARGDIGERYTQQVTGGMQDLVSRGLSGTTIGPSMELGAERERQRALRLLDESIGGQKLGLETGLLGMETGIMERRSDEYPNMEVLLSLMRLQGASGMGNLNWSPLLGGGTKKKNYDVPTLA